MQHTFAIRIDIETGERTQINFGEIDGRYFHDAGYPLQDGTLHAFSTETALLIVNRWNYLSQLQTRTERLYYLSTAEGAV